MNWRLVVALFQLAISLWVLAIAFIAFRAASRHQKALEARLQSDYPTSETEEAMTTGTTTTAL